MSRRHEQAWFDGGQAIQPLLASLLLSNSRGCFCSLIADPQLNHVYIGHSDGSP